MTLPKQTLQVGVVTMFILGGTSASAAPQVPVPSAGTYVCRLSSMNYINGMLLPNVSPSVLNRISLDGRGNYNLENKNGGPGKYIYNVEAGRFTFTTGKMSVFDVAYEYTDDGFKEQRFTLQLVDRASGKNTQTYCTLVAKTRGKPLTNVPGNGGASATPSTTEQPRAGNPNPGFKGTLVFFESYNVGAIQSLDLTTGKKQTRLSGTDPFLARNGELVYVNRQQEVLIADKSYQRTVSLKREGESGEVSQPALSADGQRVAYVRDAYPDWKGVVVRSRTGQKLAEFEWKLSPSWTPDGRLVLAEDAGYDGHRPGLLVSSLDLKSLKPIAVNIDDLKQPVVSPDGKQVAFISNGDVWAVGLDGRGFRQRTSTDQTEEGPAWSPDSQSLVLIVDPSSGVLNLLGPKDNQPRPVHDAQGDPVQIRGRLFWR
ncbi:TolB family protein [Deinococcus alpinitundrae]|uniref:TolB family protein n=1 Tax=Deinococcus alpinitundrae TaxID=468913 RepID=UPI0013793B25|nr:PD40 domain-containing protein [Deinococcus alpinitundrae]